MMETKYRHIKIKKIDFLEENNKTYLSQKNTKIEEKIQKRNSLIKAKQINQETHVFFFHVVRVSRIVFND